MGKIKNIFHNKIIHGIYTFFKTVFFVLIIIYLALIIFQKISTSANVWGFRTYNIVTASMMPEYKVGDVIITQDINPQELKVGDDIAYYGKEGEFAQKIITHRIIDIIPSDTEIKFQTKGLANTEVDPVISQKQVFGKVVYRPKLISAINKIIRTNVGFFFFVFVPLAIVIFLEVTDTIVGMIEDKKRRQEEEEII